MNKTAMNIIFGAAITLICSAINLFFSTLLNFQLKYGGFSVVKMTPLTCIKLIGTWIYYIKCI